MGGRHKRRMYTGTYIYHQKYIPFLTRVAAFRESAPSMKSCITRIAIFETIVKMPIISHPLLEAKSRQITRDNRICLSAKYRKLRWLLC